MTRLMKVLSMRQDVYYALLHGGGGKGAAPEPAPMVAPTAPVEEASVEIDDDVDKNKVKSTKQSLKVPLTAAPDTGLSI